MYIAFEGGEGSGKGSTIKYITSELKSRGYEIQNIIEPGGTDVGIEIRRILLNGGTLKISEKTETLLFFAARAQLVSDVVRPALEKGAIVLADRCYESSIAYQGYGRGVDLQELYTLAKISIGDTVPDLIILLDVEPRLGLSRERTQDEINRFELEEIDFHERVRKGYIKMAEQDSKRWVVIDASQPIEEVQNQALSLILKVLDKKQKQGN